VKLSERLAQAEESAPRGTAPATTRRTVVSAPRRTATSRPTTAARRKNGAARTPAPIEGLDDLRAKVRSVVVERLGPTLADGDVDDETLRKELGTALDESLRGSRVSVPPSERAAFLDSTLEEMLGWGVLTPLMDDPTVTEIMCNGPHEVWVERAGRIEPTDVRFPN